MNGRTFSSEKYRYGFNGKENDNEVKGQGNQQDYGMRIYDPRLGRFLSVDPITSNYPELTPYQFASNRPIDGIDMDGLEFGNINVFGAIINQTEAKIKVLNNAGVDTKTIEPWLTGLKIAKGGLVATGLAGTLYGGVLGLIAVGPAVGTPLLVSAITGVPVNPAPQAMSTLASTAVKSAPVAGKLHQPADLPDEALVVRGGTNTAQQWEKGTGVTLDANGNIIGASVNSQQGANIVKLSESIPNNKVGVTTVGEVRSAGGNVVPSPTVKNPAHATLEGVSPAKISETMKVIVKPKIE